MFLLLWYGGVHYMDVRVIQTIGGWGVLYLPMSEIAPIVLVKYVDMHDSINDS